MSDLISRSAAVEEVTDLIELEYGYEGIREDVAAIFAGLPAVDAVEVVRCGECKHYDGKWFCELCGVPSRKADDFCSYGERKDDGYFQNGNSN